MYEARLLPTLCQPCDAVHSRDSIQKIVRQYTRSNSYNSTTLVVSGWFALNRPRHILFDDHLLTVIADDAI